MTMWSEVSCDSRFRKRQHVLIIETKSTPKFNMRSTMTKTMTKRNFVHGTGWVKYTGRCGSHIIHEDDEWETQVDDCTIHNTTHLTQSLFFSDEADIDTSWRFALSKVTVTVCRFKFSFVRINANGDSSNRSSFTIFMERVNARVLYNTYYLWNKQTQSLWCKRIP